MEEGLRHFWLTGIHNSSGSVAGGLGNWLKRKGYTIISIVERGEFSLQAFEFNKLASGFAQDSTKMASASFETMLALGVTPNLPKSAGWIVIKSYYAAFFASHGLLRMCGLSCLQLDQTHIRTLNDVALQNGYAGFQGFEAGFYVAQYDSLTGLLHFRKSAASRRGSHEILWGVFSNYLQSVSNTLLTLGSSYTLLAVELSAMELLLRQDGQNGGNWLSHVRNITNYRHENGVWFPYAGTNILASELVGMTKKWRNDPYGLLPIPVSQRVKTHVSLCTVIVAMCYGMAIDMDNNTQRRRSFHSNGCLALARLSS